MKYTNILGTEEYLIGVVKDGNDLVLETPQYAYILQGTGENNKLFDAIVGGIAKGLHNNSNFFITDNNELHASQQEDVVLYIGELIDKECKILMVERYKNNLNVITGDGVFEVSYLDYSQEDKVCRLNIAGEYNDYRLVPNRGTSYKQLIDWVSSLEGSTDVIDLRSTDGIIVKDKLKFKLESI